MRLPESANVLLLGSGGREHAFAWKIAQSKRLARLFIAPGNAGTALCGTNVDINPTNFGSVKQFVLSNNINMVVVGPEEPLVRGIYDFFREDSQISNIPVIGPSALGARLEGSKEFAKDFMTRHGIPTARYQQFHQKERRGGVRVSGDPAGSLCAEGRRFGRRQGRADRAFARRGEEGARRDAVGPFRPCRRYGRDRGIPFSGIECSVFVATDGKSYRDIARSQGL